MVTGRGSVPYVYRIEKTEITTAQWVRFYNAFSARPDPAPISLIGHPVWWGASIDPSYHGPGTRYIAPGVAGQLPVAGIDWRTAARFCNWLCNNKSTDYSALDHGAYDTSTFGYDAQGRFTDQVAHTPGAQYWIPTLDEWIKAAHFDPNYNGAGQGGWWTYPISSNTAPIYGPPPGFPNGSAANQANSGFAIGQGGQWSIPTGSYPNAASPWGLLDAAGGVREWTESIYENSVSLSRVLDGSYAGSGDGLNGDLVYSYAADLPNAAFSVLGFRVASAVTIASERGDVL